MHAIIISHILDTLEIFKINIKITSNICSLQLQTSSLQLKRNQWIHCD